MGKKKQQGKKAPPGEDNDDFEAALREAQADVPSVQEESPAPAPVEEPATEGKEEDTDAAAAFLVSMGQQTTKSGADNKKKKHKKKGHNKGGENEVEEEIPVSSKQSAKGKLIAERLAKQKAEEERLRQQREEEERRIREEEERLEKEAKEAEEKRQEKLRRRAEKKAEAKRAGTYETKKQREQRLAAERRRAALQGMIPGTKKSETSTPKSAQEKRSPPAEIKAEPPKQEEAPPQPPSEEKNDEIIPPLPAPAQEEEDDALDDWEDAADDWESSEQTLKIAQLADLAHQGEDEEDLADAELQAEKERLRLAGLALKEREEKKRLAEEERARLAAVAEEEKDRVNHEVETKIMAARAQRLEREKKNEEARSLDRLRAPICCIMGHVDTGKTKLLDKIRQTNVQDGEAGGITQQIGATYFDKATLVEKIKPVREFLESHEKKPSAIDSILFSQDSNLSDADSLRLPALMIIDTPGHEAFSNLRSRGSSLCDMAIVVVDLMHGLEPQTLESISMLKRKRTPFVVALNKIDRCYDWKPIEGASIRSSLATQAEHTRQEFQQRFEQCSVELNEQGLNVSLYWENTDPKTYVSIVPTSAITGEGVPDLLRTVLSLTQQRLAEKLMWCATLQCTVLEVKVVEGLGATLDVILVNGTLFEGDTLVVCTQEGALVTQARALLTPPPSRETRVKTELIKHERIEAAVGLKITGPNLDKVVPGTSVFVCGPDDSLDDLKEEVMRDVSALVSSLATEDHGVSVQASTLGALEALLEFLRNPGKDRDGKERAPIPVFSASVGPIYKKDVIRASVMGKKGHEEYACILGFDVPVDRDARAHAEEVGVQIFTADIIYHLENHFTRHLDDIMERKRNEARDIAVFPVLVRISPKHVFNAKDPIVVGVTVDDGILKVGTPLCIPHNGFLDVGVVQSIECNHKEVDRVKKGQECAIKIVNQANPTLTYGRQFDATHTLYSKLSRGTF
uniref:Eukaryotic translation initiation factor 5B n=1 Tax=Aureoumbra lagunensis TaxID=44058 RepID=A0A7S3JYZ7_9STRA